MHFRIWHEKDVVVHSHYAIVYIYIKIGFCERERETFNPNTHCNYYYPNYRILTEGWYYHAAQPYSSKIVRVICESILLSIVHSLCC